MRFSPVAEIWNAWIRSGGCCGFAPRPSRNFAELSSRFGTRGIARVVVVDALLDLAEGSRCGGRYCVFARSGASAGETVLRGLEIALEAVRSEVVYGAIYAADQLVIYVGIWLGRICSRTI